MFSKRFNESERQRQLPTNLNFIHPCCNSLSVITTKSWDRMPGSHKNKDNTEHTPPNGQQKYEKTGVKVVISSTS